MTLDPLLLKAAEYAQHICGQPAAKLPYFNPKGPTASPWTATKAVPTGLALVTLKQIHRCLPDLKLFVQRTSDRIKHYHPMLQGFSVTISHIRSHCRAKVQKAPKMLCARIYGNKVEDACSKIIKDVNEFSLLEMTVRVNKLFPLVMTRNDSKIMHMQIDAIIPLMEGEGFTEKMRQKFEEKKSCLKSIVELHNVLWKIGKLIQRLETIDIDDFAVLRLEERFARTINRCHEQFFRHPALFFRGVSIAIAIKCQKFNHLMFVYRAKRNIMEIKGFFRRLIS